MPADIAASANVSSRMLQRPAAAMASTRDGSGTDATAKVAKTLVDLRDERVVPIEADGLTLSVWWQSGTASALDEGAIVEVVDRVIAATLERFGRLDRQGALARSSAVVPISAAGLFIAK